MQPYLSTVCFLSLLLAKGSCLVCEVCTNFMANSCSGEMQVCSSSENVCIATLSETALGSERNAVFEKACSSSLECFQAASMTAGAFRSTIISRCCSSNYCNNETIEWQPMNNTANGKICPSCIAQNSLVCEKPPNINCTGDETQCIKLTAVKQRGSQLIMQGCATNSMSESKGKAAFTGASVVVTDFSHTSSSSKGSQAMLHPALPALTVHLLFHLFCLNPS